MPPYNERRATPDINALYAAKFPESPNTAKVAANIQEIYAIPVVWETAQQNKKYAMGDLTPKALTFSYRPAFKFVMASLIDNASLPRHSFNAQETFAWYKTNKNSIHFDVAQKIFVAG